jgi:hypothetical protein
VGGSVSATFSQVAAYLAGNCATSTACHGTGAREVVLRGTALYRTLTTLTVAKCSNRPAVVPGDPAGSALYGVLTGDCGRLLMPPGCAPTPPCGTAINLQIVQSWIQSGALEN